MASDIPRSAVPCAICGKLPEWSAYFLICSSSCPNESEYNDPRGNAVRSWNKQQEKIKINCTKEIRDFRKCDTEQRKREILGQIKKYLDSEEEQAALRIW